MSKKSVNLKTFLLPKLRRISYLWPSRKQAKIASRVERGRYKCAICNNLFGPTEVSMDHISPVVDLTGFVDWNTYIERLFCDISGYQSLCSACHDSKTNRENGIRKMVKAELKTTKKGKKK